MKSTGIVIVEERADNALGSWQERVRGFSSREKARSWVRNHAQPNRIYRIIRELEVLEPAIEEVRKVRLRRIEALAKEESDGAGA